MQRTATRSPVWSETSKRIGYGVSAAINALLILVVNSLLSWGWPSFLTEDFSQVLPVINLSLGATVLVNVAYVSYDPPRFKSLCRIMLGAISMLVAIRTWVVFPFDFSGGTGVNWTVVVRIILMVAMFGTGVGIIADAVKLIGGTSRREV